MAEKEIANTEPDLFQGSLPLKKAARIYSVSAITQDIKLILENTFGQVWVEGELSGVSKIPTGTTFFTLKDETSILKCVLFSSALQQIKFELKIGIKVVCFGQVSVYNKRGEYQLYVQQMEPKGIGSLQLALEQLKQKLEKEGLFSPAHKKAIPYLPSRIGVVTSVSGAAIKDILKILDARFRDTHIIINPVRVQGEGAKEEIAKAINDFNIFNRKASTDKRIEVMIVGRGGGSIEDLWAFNEEIVARAIYSSTIPIISAVGHERDWTIADLVADVRAATPSVAAELVIPKKEELKDKLDTLTQDLGRSLLDVALDMQENIDDLARRLILSAQHLRELNAGEFESALKKLKLLNPASLIRNYQEKTLDLAQQIYVRFNHFIELRESGFVKAAEKLSGLSPLNILARGYSITFQMPDGKTVKDALSLKPGELIKTKLHKGEILSQVREVKGNG